MAFDLSTAKPVAEPGRFDLSTARPVGDNQEAPPQPEPSFYDKMRGYIGGFAGNVGGAVADTFTNPMAGAKSAAATLASVNQMGPGAMAVPGEMASGANQSVMDFLDLLAKTGNMTAGGYQAMLNLLQGKPVEEPSGTRGPIPMPSAVLGAGLDAAGVDSRPGAPVMPPSAFQAVTRATGTLLPAAAGMKPVAGRDVTRLPGQAAELGGFGSATPAQTAAAIQSTADDLNALGRNSPEYPAANLPKKVEREFALLRGSGDEAGAGYRLDQMVEGPVKDPVQIAAIKQGHNPGIVAMVRTTTDKGKRAMLEMLGIVKRAKANAREGGRARPDTVIGKGLNDRLKVVVKANKIAGRQIDKEAQKLRGQSVDLSAAMSEMRNRLAKLDIGISDDGVLQFDSSEFRSSPTSQKLLQQTYDDLLRTGDDAHQAHVVKRVIDNQVSYGRQSEGGIAGSAERLVKDVRAKIDDALDKNFPDYNNANTQYSRTRGIIDEMEDIAGKKVDLTGDYAPDALGQLSRRVLSNATSRARIMKAVEDLDLMSQEYLDSGSSVIPARVLKRATAIDKLDDDIIGQLKFSSYLDEVFGTLADRSLQGEVYKGGARAARSVLRDKTDAVIGAVDYGINKAQGINEENYMQSLIKLLREK